MALKFNPLLKIGLDDTGSGGAATTPGGSDTQVQFNNAGAFGGDSGFIWNNTNKAAVLSSSQSTQDGLKVTNSHGSANQIFAVTGWGNRSNTYGGLMGYSSSYAEWVGVYGKQGDGGSAIVAEKTTSTGHAFYAYGNTFLNGGYDEVQLTVQGHSTQTSNIFLVEKSDGTDLFSVSNTGVATLIGDLELGHATDTTLSRSSAGVLAVEGVVIPSISSTNTLTNKRITPRVVTASDATSITPNTDSADITYQSNTQGAGTLTINADGGTPTNGQKWMLKIKSTNAQTYSWNAVYVSGTDVTLPTVSTAGKIDNIGFIYDTVNSKWECVSVAKGY